METEENGHCREVLNKSQCMDFFVRLDEKKWQLLRGGRERSFDCIGGNHEI